MALRRAACPGRLHLAIAVGAALFAASPAQCFALGRPVVGGDVGSWTLRGLGLPPIVRLDKRNNRRAFHYQVPQGVVQGKPFWYVFSAHVSATFDSGTAAQYVAGVGTNGHAVAQIILTVTQSGVMADTLGLVTGRRHTSTNGRSISVRVENYIQVGGIHGGRNQLDFRFETLSHSRLAGAVNFLPDSELKVTPAPPDELHLTAPNRIVAAAGDTFDVPFRVSRRGWRPDAPLTVIVTTPGGGVAPSGASARSFRAIGRAKQGHFSLRAHAPGQYPVTLGVPNEYNEPSANISVLVGHRVWRINGRVAAGLIGVLLLVGALLLRLRTPRRSGS